jgi:Domain of unknown function (DUF4129)
MKRAALILTLILLVAPGVSAETLLKYENRVARAAEQVARIKSDAEYEISGVEDIRQLMPRQEQVEHEGRTLKIDNTWLSVALDVYSAERDPQKKTAKLAEIGDRLAALDAALISAAETSPGKAGGEETRAKLREILNRRDYHEKEEGRFAAFVRKIYNKVSDFIVQLRDAFGRMLKKTFSSAAEGSLVSKILVIVVLGVFLFFILRLATKIKPRRKAARKRTVLGEEIEANATPGDLFEAAMAAAQAGDFRAAVRKLYISLLYELSERSLIELDESATNHEYLARLAHFEPLVAPVSAMTDRFDVSWYGMFPTSQEEFSTCLARYNEAMQRAKTLTPEAAS